jgi:hypothetical protein
MKRSGGVTAAAVVLLVGGALLVLLVLFGALVQVVLRAMKIQQPGAPQGQGMFVPLLFVLGMEGLFAAWAIVTAIGIFRLRNWARISMLILAGYVAVISASGVVTVLLVIPMLEGTQIPSVSSGAHSGIQIAFVAILAIPLGCGIWWLIIFLQKSVRLQFQVAAMERASASAAGAVALPQSGIFEAPVMLPTPAAEGAKLPKIPTSILVIAIWLVASAPFALLVLPYAISQHMPNVFFGILVTGWKAGALLGATLAFASLAGVGLLLKKPRAIDGTIGYAVFALVNSALSAFSPATGELMDVTLRTMKYPPEIQMEVMRHFMHRMMSFNLVFSGLLAVAALYFLVTRRRAYFAACAGRPGAG